MFAKWKRQRRVRRLLAAIDRDEVEEFRLLLAAQESVGELTSAEYARLLHYACDIGERSAFVHEILATAGRGSINIANGVGLSAIHLSVTRGDIDSVRILLEAGANPNARDRDGVTPLNLCKSFQGTSEMAQLLLDHGADPNLVDKHGKNYMM